MTLIIGQRIGDGGRFTVGYLAQYADVQQPVTVKIMLNMQAAGGGGVVVAGVVLTILAFSGIQRRREMGPFARANEPGSPFDRSGSS